MSLVIDASVWVAAQFEGEPSAADSAACVMSILAGGEDIVLPLLTWLECAAAVARKTGSPDLARRTGLQLRGLDRVQWVRLDDELAEEAAAVAALCRLRAADAVYVAVAQRSAAMLITLDAEIRERCPAHVKCVSPSDWIREEAGPPA